ncbi:MAG: phytase [Cyclobacteriaceae bacterium]|nr:phytase [Cyclobacteriaceae bacterium]
MRFIVFTCLFVSFSLLTGCKHQPKEAGVEGNSTALIYPAVVTEKVPHDTDDPAIWINPKDSTDVLIVGTDKGGDTNEGGLYVFNLEGKIVNRFWPLKRPNNVDIAYGLKLGKDTVDIAVCTERNTNTIRVFTLPDLTPIDAGGIPVFEGESMRDPMGIALFTNREDNKIYAIVGRKTGPQDGSYLWQYLLEDDGSGKVIGSLKRKFGFYSGKKEIESIAVDNELGFVYHSDEQHGIHKSYAHPDSSNVELALFGTSGFTEDIEGISIYKLNKSTGYILVSDQQAGKFRVFPREGQPDRPHEHPEIFVVPLAIAESDGSDVTSQSLPGFPHGLFVAMSDEGTFQYYRWEEMAGITLQLKNK